MAMDTNTCVFTGHLGADPEQRYNKSGDGVCNFRIAINGYKDSVIWLRVNVWGRGSEACTRYLHKGSMVLVKGELQMREWTDKEGRKRESWELRAAMFGGVQFLDRKGESADEVNTHAGEPLPF